MSAVQVRLSPARELSGYYDNIEGCQFINSIYDFTFMDVDKILPFSSTLGWHSLKVNGEVQKSKGLPWIPSHPEERKGVQATKCFGELKISHLTRNTVFQLHVTTTLLD
jgi:hypothetical protein